MPKTIKKTTLKPKISRKKKRTTAKKVPKTDPKQQSVLKNLFVTQKSGTKKRTTDHHQRLSSAKPNQQPVWRRTVLRNKPKPKPKDKLPRLFRMDNTTGLPVDYEQTVDRVMHYVNPHLTSRPRTEQVMENLLTNMFMEMMSQSFPDPKVPAHMCCRDEKAPVCCREHQTKRYIQTLLSVNRREPIKQSKRQANEDLSDFYSACKRGPRQISPKLGPTKACKFNFNQLRIKSQ